MKDLSATVGDTYKKLAAVEERIIWDEILNQLAEQDLWLCIYETQPRLTKSLKIGSDLPDELEDSYSVERDIKVLLRCGGEMEDLGLEKMHQRLVYNDGNLFKEAICK